jgi:hypothetical protein
METTMAFSRLSFLGAAILSATICDLPPAAAGDLIKPTSQWSLETDFGKSEKARTNLSGAACVPASSFTSCVVVNDDKKYAQAFSITGTTLRPARIIRLMSEDVEGDPDAEGTAYHDGFFYVTGSHGRPRNHPERSNPASYTLFRFPVDARTQQPNFTADEQVEGLETTFRLREALSTLAPIAAQFDRPLGNGGINVEGLAVRKDRIYFGLRGPSIDRRAFIVSVDRRAMFSRDAPLKAEVHNLGLGADTGIRDLAAVGNGLLVLSGPVNNQDLVAAVSLLGDDGALTRLGELDVSAAGEDAKAETLLVLAEDKASLRVLVMFDGPSNGMPMEYVLRR